MIDSYSDHVIVCGFGRVGRQVARDLQHAGVAQVAIDSEHTNLEAAEAMGVPLHRELRGRRRGAARRRDPPGPGGDRLRRLRRRQHLHRADRPGAGAGDPDRRARIGRGLREEAAARGRRPRDLAVQDLGRRDGAGRDPSPGRRRRAGGGLPAGGDRGAGGVRGRRQDAARRSAATRRSSPCGAPTASSSPSPSPGRWSRPATCWSRSGPRSRWSGWSWRFSRSRCRAHERAAGSAPAARPGGRARGPRRRLRAARRPQGGAPQAGRPGRLLDQRRDAAGAGAEGLAA